MANSVVPYLPLAIAGAVAGVYLYKHRKINDVTIPEPSALRKDLLYGYYGTIGGQAYDTKGFVNLLWEAQFEGIEKATQNILIAETFTVLDVANQSMVRFASSGRNYKFHTNAENNLRELFRFMSSKGALKYVKVITPMDEPNTNVLSQEDFQKSIDAVLKVAKEFPELADVKLGVIYAAKPQEYWCIEQFDFVGVDDYDSKSQIFFNGTYEGIKSRLKPGAKSIILPGGGFGQDPQPFINFAHNNQEVGMLVPFTWLDPMQQADTWVGLGNDLNPRKQAYIDVGKTIVGLNK